MKALITGKYSKNIYVAINPKEIKDPHSQLPFVSNNIILRSTLSFHTVHNSCVLSAVTGQF